MYTHPHVAPYAGIVFRISVGFNKIHSKYPQQQQQKKTIHVPKNLIRIRLTFVRIYISHEGLIITYNRNQ